MIYDVQELLLKFLGELIVLSFILNCPIFYNSGSKWGWGGFCIPRGHLVMTGGTPHTHLSQLGRKLLLASRDAAKHPTAHSTASTETVHLAQNVSSAKIQKPCFRGHVEIFIDEMICLRFVLK